MIIMVEMKRSDAFTQIQKTEYTEWYKEYKAEGGHMTLSYWLETLGDMYRTEMM